MQRLAPVRVHRLVARFAAGIVAIGSLCGALVVSCAGDSTPGSSGTSSRGNSHAVGQWTPATVDTCTQTQHDQYLVTGPDGKKYPTWHPAVDPATGCTFGHDHGDDPSNSPQWDDLRRHFAYDANGNGAIDADELAASGVPFGYVAEQLDAYNTAHGIAASDGQRHQAHTSYKIVLGTLKRDRLVAGVAQAYGLYCNHLLAYNQDVASADAFASNVHEVVYAIDCNQGTDAASYPVKLIVSGMANFGVRQQFDGGAPDATTDSPIVVNQAPVPANSPLGSGKRALPAATTGVFPARLLDNLLVLSGATSDLDAGMRESWQGEFDLATTSGPLAIIRPWLTAPRPSRYYDDRSATLTGNSIGLCYGWRNGSDLVTDQVQTDISAPKVRGINACTNVAPNGPATPIAQRVASDVAASPVRNCEREAIFNDQTVTNAVPTTIWYSDPFGGNAQASRFSGSVKQYVAAANVGSNVVLTPATVVRTSSCADSVHLPN